MGTVASMARHLRARGGAYLVQRRQVNDRVALLRKHPGNALVVSRTITSLFELLLEYDEDDRPIVLGIIHSTHVAPLLVRTRPLSWCGLESTGAGTVVGSMSLEVCPSPSTSASLDDVRVDVTACARLRSRSHAST